ncbi:unnamed protein product [Brugia timori]|uniref:E1_dh domain-containing protein n=1 Tax=Brugia timori TaxID=42155 RepID=A0A0R3QV77_9BILA|nr:unnamed protein product [Brugia timori]
MVIQNLLHKIRNANFNKMNIQIFFVTIIVNHLLKLSILRHRSFTAQLVRHVSEASFQVQPFKLHRLKSGPSTNVTVTKSDALKMYKQMQVIRKMEQASDLLYKDRKIRGFCHLYAGQEACAVGLYAAKHPDDSIITSYRCHGFTYLVRNSVKEILSELLG